MQSNKYIRKPVVIEAIQYTGDESVQEMKKLWGNFFIMFHRLSPTKVFTVETNQGEAFVKKGDWVIKGPTGEIYPCKPDIFELTYEAVKS